MAVADTAARTTPGSAGPPRSPVGAGRPAGVVMPAAGAVGWLASLQLTVDDWRVPGDPSYQPSCGISPVVGCGSVLSSWQGSLLGFPDMLLGLGASRPSPRWGRRCSPGPGCTGCRGSL